MKAFHGTCLEHARTMVESGFKSSKEALTWNCSGYTDLYVYPLNKVFKNSFNVGEAEEYSTILERALTGAAESALTNAAVHNSQHRHIVVFEFNFPRNLLEDDFSCPYMSEIASYIEEKDMDVKYLETVYVIDAYAPSLRLFHLASHAGNEYLGCASLSPQERSALDSLTRSDFFLDSEDLYAAVSEARAMTPEEFKFWEP